MIAPPGTPVSTPLPWGKGVVLYGAIRDGKVGTVIYYRGTQEVKWWADDDPQLKVVEEGE